jgi:hypothetical protein
VDKELEAAVKPASGVDRGDGTEQALSDEDLAELALAADPDAGIAADAIPLDELLESDTASPSGDLLPGWYMPPPMGRSGLLQGWRRRTVFVIIASFILITAYGLCTTYGVVGFG